MDTELEQQEAAILTTIRNHDDAERARIHNAAPVPSEQEVTPNYHVSLPLQVAHDGVTIVRPHPQAKTLFAKQQGYVVAKVVFATKAEDNSPADESKEYARRLVDAFNSHAELKERVRELETILQACTESLQWTLQVMPDIPQASTFRENLDNARAALSKSGVASP